MGYAIAEAALEAGHDVILISGPVNLPAPSAAKLVSVSTSDEMHDTVHERIGHCDVLVMCAAVADYKPAKFSDHKIKKGREPVSLELIPTRDILTSLPHPRKFLVVGFAAETKNLHANAKAKLQNKNCDLVVANDVSRVDVGMESADNEVTIFFSSGEIRKISRAPKKKIADELVKIISNMKKNV